MLQSSPYKQPFSFPRRFRRGTRWLVRSLYFPVFLRIRNLPSPVSRSQTTRSPSFPRRIFAPGVLHRCFTHPESRGGGAPRDVRVRAKHPLGLHMTRQARRLARRLASYDAGRSPRRSTVAVLGSGAVLASPAFAPDRLQRAPRTRRSAWRATSRASRGKRLRSRHRGTPRLAPHSGSSLEHALNERGCQPSRMASICSQI